MRIGEDLSLARIGEDRIGKDRSLAETGEDRIGEDGSLAETGEDRPLAGTEHKTSIRLANQTVILLNE